MYRLSVLKTTVQQTKNELRTIFQFVIHMEPIKFFSTESEFYELSNFYELQEKMITPIFRLPCKTSEHYYHALKYEFKDAPSENEKMVRLIVNCKTPYMAKIVANAYRSNTPQRYEWQRNLVSKAQSIDATVINGLDEDYKVKLKLMKQTLKTKFKVDEHCREVLLSTGNKKLEEDSPYDSFWGIGRNGNGKNYLGRLLMKLRDKIRQDVQF